MYEETIIMSKQKPTIEATGVQTCKCSGCKKSEAKYSFCDEHYEWFKFGLITKEGKKVMDFDKKQGHYQAYLDRQHGYKKVA